MHGGATGRGRGLRLGRAFRIRLQWLDQCLLEQEREQERTRKRRDVEVEPAMARVANLQQGSAGHRREEPLRIRYRLNLALRIRRGNRRRPTPAG